MPVDSASPHILHASAAVSGGWLTCDQLPDEARVLARNSAIGGFSSPTNCAATVYRQPHSPLPTPADPPHFYLFPPRNSTVNSSRHLPTISKSLPNSGTHATK